MVVDVTEKNIVFMQIYGFVFFLNFFYKYNTEAKWNHQMQSRILRVNKEV